MTSKIIPSESIDPTFARINENTKSDIITSTTDLINAKQTTNSMIGKLMSIKPNLPFTSKTKIIAEISEYERIGIIARESFVKKFYYFKYWFYSSVLIGLAECVIIAYSNNPNFTYYQIGILVLSTIFYLIGVYLTSLYVPKDIKFIVHRVAHCFDAVMIYETFFLLIGWIFLIILKLPGYAALRVLRVPRFFWFYEFMRQPIGDQTKLSRNPLSIAIVSQKIVYYIGRIGIEMFTAASKGGLVLLILFFFLDYVIAVVIWSSHGSQINTPEGTLCSDLGICFITLMRLSFYDGNGLDLLQYSVTDGYYGITLLLYLYLITTAIFVLNALIGIFGNAFQVDDEDPKEQEQDVIVVENKNASLNNETLSSDNNNYNSKNDKNNNSEIVSTNITNEDIMKMLSVMQQEILSLRQELQTPSYKTV